MFFFCHAAHFTRVLQAHVTPRFTVFLLAGLGLTCTATALGAAGSDPDDVRTGQATLLARYAEIQPGTCRALMAPVVTLTQRPTQGRLWLARGQAQVRVSGCESQSAPVTEVWFEAVTGPGKHPVAWQVRYQAKDRATQAVRREIVVAP